MKKIISVMMIMLLCLAGLALAEGGENLTGAYEDGNYVIRIPVEAGDEGWMADDMSQDDSVVKLNGAEIVDGVFTASYAPVADGEIVVTVKHMDGIACDQVHTFDLKVSDGKIENVGGAYTASPDEAELDAVIGGAWLVNDDIMAGMTIEKNEGKGWALQIASAYPEVQVLQADLFYDCELNEFVYANATIYDSEITNSPEVTVGEATFTGAGGTLAIREAENGEVNLVWFNDQAPEETNAFYRPDGYGEAAEDADSDWYMEILADESIAAEYPYHQFVDVNGDGVPVLLISTTESDFITDEDSGRIYVCADGAKLVKEFGGGAGEKFYFNADAHTLTYYYRASGESHIEVYRVADGALETVTTLDHYAQHHYPERDSDADVYLRDGEEIPEDEFNAEWDACASDDDVITYEAM